ncbi:MAG: gamma-glutamyltransferase [Geminicoccaceae bacterium]
MAQSRTAAEVGAEVLRSGGNAVDAAVATSLALGAVEPWMSGLGGGGCMLVWIAREQRAFAVEFGMVAPAALDPSDYPLAGGKGGDLFGWPAVLDDRNVHGPYSIGVPGYLDGLVTALERFGTQRFADLVAPAADLAEQGLAIDWYASLQVTNSAAVLRRYPDTASVWLPAGLPPPTDWTGALPRLPLGALATTLRRLADDGPRSFYEGATAEQLVGDLAAIGCKLTASDLAGYRATVRPAESCAYRDASFALTGSLFGGPTFARSLEFLDAAAFDAGAPGEKTYVSYARALKDAFAHRLGEMGEAAGAPSCTSHLNVVDREGNIVALTQTLLSLFGSKVLSPSTGILLNNAIMWFDPRPGRPNSMAPGRRPLANMCPVLGRRSDGRVFALGASGGRRIIPAAVQIASFLVDYDMDPETAFATPRLDLGGGEEITLDARLGTGIAAAVETVLPVRRMTPAVHPLLWACPTAALFDPSSGTATGVAEPFHPWADAVAAD